MEIPDKDTYLRLERRNGRVFGSVSEDGVNWTSFDSFTVEIPKEIKLGVAAISTSTEPFKAEFSGLEVYKLHFARTEGLRHEFDHGLKQLANFSRTMTTNPTSPKFGIQ